MGSPARAAAPNWCVPCLNWVCEQEISSGVCCALGTVTASRGCVRALGSRGSGTVGAELLQGCGQMSEQKKGGGGPDAER